MSGEARGSAGSERTPMRVCLVGAPRAGKTALLIRLLYDEFESVYAETEENEYQATFVAGFQEVQVNFLDAGGAQSFARHRDRWFQWANVFVYVFNIRDTATFFAIKSFRDEIAAVKRKKGVNLTAVPALLVGTGSDADVQNRAVTEAMGLKMADALGCAYYETSAKYTIGMDETAFSQSGRGKSKTSRVPVTYLVELLIQERARRARETAEEELTLPGLGKGPPSRRQSHAELPDVATVSSPLDRLPPLFIELQEKWSKPLEQLPVFIDFPRLATKITVVTGPKIDPAARSAAFKRAQQANKASTLSPKSFSKQSTREPSPERPQKFVVYGTAALKSREAKKRRKARRDDTPDLTIGARVRIWDSEALGKGTIRYIGDVKFASYIVAGIELDKPFGDCDGSMLGAKYFACTPSKGVFVQTQDVQLLFHKTPPTAYAGGKMIQKLSPGIAATPEEWTFNPSTGAVTCNNTFDGKPLAYEWDGEYFKPQSGSASLGAGQWNGEHVLWYDKDWMIFRTSKRELSIKLAYNDSQKKYFAGDLLKGTHSVLMALLPWKWSSENTFSGDPVADWRVDEVGKNIPPELPVFIMLLYYRRFGGESGESIEQLVGSAESPSKADNADDKSSLDAQLNDIQPVAIPDTGTESSEESSFIDENSSLSSPHSTFDALETIPPGEPLKVTIRMNSWRFRIPISENATVAHLKHEVSKRVSKRLQILQIKLEEDKQVLFARMDDLMQKIQTTQAGNATEAATAMKEVVAIINDRIEDMENIAISQIPADEDRIYIQCEKLKELAKRMVRAAIMALKNPGGDSFVQISMVVGEAHAMADIPMTCFFAIEQVCIEESNTANATPKVMLKDEARLGDILDDNVDIAAFARPKTAAEVREEDAARKRAEADKAKRLEEEEQQKWTALFEAMEDKTHNQNVSQDAAAVLKSPRRTRSKAGSDRKSSRHATKTEVELHPMQKVLLQLMSVLDEKEYVPAVRSEWDEHVKETGDAARQLSSFLQSVLQDETRTCAVLKAINQSIIATPFVRLKLALPADLGFEDVSGTWKIIVQVTPGEEVAVLHQKAGASRDDITGGFDFQWELLMRFSWDLKTMREGMMYFTDLRIGKRLGDDRARQIREALTSFAF